MADLHNEFEKSRFFHASRLERRNADMLIGMAAGIVSDGKVTVEEACFLREWMQGNLLQLDDPVVNTLYKRISFMLQDGDLDTEESAELLDTLRSLGAISDKPTAQSHTRPTSLPLNDPEPEIIWDNRAFVFTGTMAFGPRKACEALVKERGGLIGSGISKKVDYLVIGSIGNDQWLHTSYGTKIMRAVELREAGTPIAIVCEDHWQRVLFG